MHRETKNIVLLHKNAVFYADTPCDGTGNRKHCLISQLFEDSLKPFEVTAIAK